MATGCNCLLQLFSKQLFFKIKAGHSGRIHAYAKVQITCEHILLIPGWNSMSNVIQHTNNNSHKSSLLSSQVLLWRAKQDPVEAVTSELLLCAQPGESAQRRRLFSLMDSPGSEHRYVTTLHHPWKSVRLSVGGSFHRLFSNPVANRRELVIHKITRKLVVNEITD